MGKIIKSKIIKPENEEADRFELSIAHVNSEI